MQKTRKHAEEQQAQVEELLETHERLAEQRVGALTLTFHPWNLLAYQEHIPVLATWEDRQN